MANFVSYSNMEALMTAIGAKFSALAGAYILKGSVAFNELPATLTAAMVGYVYDVNEEFTTDSRFKVAGKKCPAGTNVSVAAFEVSGETVYKFDVMSGFIDTDDIYAKIAAAVNLVAPAFSATTGYSEGDYVIYGGSIWQFNAAHAAGAWVGTDADEIGDVTDLVDGFAATLDAKIGANTAAIANISGSIADEFDGTTESYAAGDVVMHENKLYKFNAAHAAGAWIGTDADEVTLESLIEAAEPESLTSEQITALEALLG